MIFNRKFLSENIMYSKEAADYLGISKQRLIVLVNEGRIKYLKKNKPLQIHMSPLSQFFLSIQMDKMVRNYKMI